MDLKFLLPGILMLTFAFLIQPIIGMATVLYTSSTVTIQNYAPGSTDPNNPGGIYPGASMDLVVVLKYETPESIERVYVAITGGHYGTNTEIDIPFDSYDSGTQLSWYVLPEGFTSGDDPPNTNYTLTFKAIASDGRKGELTAYMTVLEADGIFYINGEPVTPDSYLIVTEPTLTIKFKATKNGEIIELVKIKITDVTEPLYPNELTTKTLSETQTDLEWTTSYTLPKYGTYKIEGWIYYGGVYYQKMSIIGGWGEPEQQTATLPMIVTSLQWTFGVIGAMLTLIGVFKKG